VLTRDFTDDTMADKAKRILDTGTLAAELYEKRLHELAVGSRAVYDGELLSFEDGSALLHERSGLWIVLH